MNIAELARLATSVENGADVPAEYGGGAGLIIGITGAPGVGKSSLVDALTAEFRRRDRTVAIVAVDPSSRSTGGAILGDRIRMSRHHADAGVFIRSMASRGEAGGLARSSAALARLFRGAGFDFVIIETVGVGQDEIRIASHADVTVVVLAPGMGDDIQSIKAGLMEVADMFVINKADRPGADQTALEIAEHKRPVFQTVAIDGTGVGELSDALTGWVRKAARAGDWGIDHVGIAVRSLEDALPFYEEQLGMGGASIERVEHEGVRVAVFGKIELLEALRGDSTIARFIEKRGPGLHHIALRVPDLAAALKRLEESGAKVLGKPQQGAGGHLYAFVHPASTGGVLWELIQA